MIYEHIIPGELTTPIKSCVLKRMFYKRQGILAPQLSNRAPLRHSSSYETLTLLSFSPRCQEQRKQYIVASSNAATGSRLLLLSSRQCATLLCIYPHCSSMYTCTTIWLAVKLYTEESTGIKVHWYIFAEAKRRR